MPAPSPHHVPWLENEQMKVVWDVFSLFEFYFWHCVTFQNFLNFEEVEIKSKMKHCNFVTL